MNIFPPKKTLWVADQKTIYTSQDYATTPLITNIIIYVIYIISWIFALQIVKMFNKTYEFIPIMLAFLIGSCLLFLLDYINILSWEISINKDTGEYVIMDNGLYLDENNDGKISKAEILNARNFKGSTRIIENNNNNIYKFDKSDRMMLIDDIKYNTFLKKKQIEDISISEWNDKSNVGDNLVTSNMINPKIKVLVDCSYYLFTTLITLSAVAIRVDKTLFNNIIPWVLISAIVGVGGIFIFIWERNFKQLLYHLAIKKKILITAISFALAACFTFISKLNLRK